MKVNQKATWLLVIVFAAPLCFGQSEPLLIPAIIEAGNRIHDTILSADENNSSYYNAYGKHPDPVIITYAPSSEKSPKAKMLSIFSPKGKKSKSEANPTNQSKYQCDASSSTTLTKKIELKPADTTGGIQWYKMPATLGDISKDHLKELFPINEDQLTALISNHDTLFSGSSEFNGGLLEQTARRSLTLDNDVRGLYWRHGISEDSHEEAYHLIMSYYDIYRRLEESPTLREGANSYSSDIDLHELTGNLELNYQLIWELDNAETSIAVSELLLTVLLNIWVENFEDLFNKQLLLKPDSFLKNLAQLVASYKALSPHITCNDATIHTMVNLLFFHHNIMPPIMTPDELDTFNPDRIEQAIREGLKKQGKHGMLHRTTLIQAPKTNDYVDIDRLPKEQ